MINNESRTVKFFKNSVSMFVYQIILMVTGFITPRVMLSFYGSQINGLVSSVAQFVGYISLVEAGLSAATIYALYKPLSDKNHKAISSVVSSAKIFYHKSGYVFLALISLLAIIYPYFVDAPNSMNYPDILLLVFISSVSGVVDLFSLAKYRALLTADQKTYILSFASMVYVVANVSIIALLAYLNLNIYIVKTTALLAVLLRSAILLFYCKRNYPYIDYNAKPDFSTLSKRWDAFFQQILGVIQNGSPIVIITLVSKNLALVSIYTVYNMVTAALNSLLSIFISGLSASFGEVISKGEKETLRKAYSEFETTYYILICVVYSIAFIMIMPFIRLYTDVVTDANYYQPILGFLFVLNGFLYNLKTPQGMLVLSAGLYKETRYQNLIQALLIIIVGVPLSFIFGIKGVMIGLLVSNIYRNIDLLCFIPKNVTGLPIWSTIKKWIIMIINIAIIFGLSSLFKPSIYNYFSWILSALFICVVSLILNLVTFSFICRKDIRLLFIRIKKLIK